MLGNLGLDMKEQRIKKLPVLLHLFFFSREQVKGFTFEAVFSLVY